MSRNLKTAFCTISCSHIDDNYYDNDFDKYYDNENDNDVDDGVDDDKDVGVDDGDEANVYLAIFPSLLHSSDRSVKVFGMNLEKKQIQMQMRIFGPETCKYLF